MKIGIMTYHRAENYGSALQAYALCSYLKGIHQEPEVIDYHTSGQDGLYTIFVKPRSLMSIARNVQSLFFYRKLRRKKRGFQTFIEKEIPHTRDYTEQSDLNALNSQFDIFICGSDQIWNPNCADFSNAYLLDFVTDKGRCLSYAPSLGGNDIATRYADLFRQYLSAFKAVSVREQSGAEQISAILDRPVATLPDPVLLLDRSQWDSIASPRLIKEKYIFCYYIGDVDQMRGFATRMHKATGWPLVVVNKNLRDALYGCKKLYDAGPTEFISLIKHSEFICTNSFHAVMFSLIYHKNFWVFTDLGAGTAKSRIENILQLTGLEERELNLTKTLPENLVEPVDYSHTDMVLRELSNRGANFLRKGCNILLK